MQSHNAVEVTVWHGEEGEVMAWGGVTMAIKVFETHWSVSTCYIDSGLLVHMILLGFFPIQSTHCSMQRQLWVWPLEVCSAVQKA